MSGQDQQTQQQTQASKTDPWAPAQPALMDLLKRYGGMSTDVTGGQSQALASLTGAASGIPNFGNAATGTLANLWGSDTSPQVGMLTGAFNQLNNNIGGTASGAELDPYNTPGFSDAINTMTNDITNKVKGVYAGSGRDPSGAGSFAGSLGRGLTQGISPTIAAQFNQNKQNQLGAANTLFGAGGTTAGGITQQQQVPLTNAMQALGLIPAATNAYTAPATAQLGAANTAYSQPWTNLQSLLGPLMGIAGLGQSSSGTSNTVNTTPQNTMSNILGGVTGGVGLLSLLSDVRAKDDIEPIGKLHDGQNVVRFRYKGDPKMRIGLIAQEVENFVPQAVHKLDGGMLTVDHRRATDRAAAIGRRVA